MCLVDIITIVIIGLFVYSGIRSGLIRTAIRFGSLFLSLFIAFFAYPMFSEMIYSSDFSDKVSEHINTEYVLPYINNIVSENIDTQNGILSLVAKDIDVYSANAAEGISDKITSAFINFLAFLVIVVFSRVIFSLIARVLLDIARFPIIKQLNSFAGGIFGFLQGLIICILATALIAIISPFNDTVREFDVQIQNSKISSHIYNNNIILNTISNFDKK